MVAVVWPDDCKDDAECLPCPASPPLVYACMYVYICLSCSAVVQSGLSPPGNSQQPRPQVMIKLRKAGDVAGRLDKGKLEKGVVVLLADLEAEDFPRTATVS